MVAVSIWFGCHPAIQCHQFCLTQHPWECDLSHHRSCFHRLVDVALRRSLMTWGRGGDPELPSLFHVGRKGTKRHYSECQPKSVFRKWAPALVLGWWKWPPYHWKGPDPVSQRLPFLGVVQFDWLKRLCPVFHKDLDYAYFKTFRVFQLKENPLCC